MCIRDRSRKENSISWPFPPLIDGAVYPYNRVRLTESGHLFEADDTPGFERVKEAHRVGTFYEILPDGTKVTKVVSDNFTLVVGDDNVHVQGACHITVEGDCNLYTNGNFTQQVNGDYNLWVQGNWSTTVDGVEATFHHANADPKAIYQETIDGARNTTVSLDDKKEVFGNMLLVLL